MYAEDAKAEYKLGASYLNNPRCVQARTEVKAKTSPHKLTQYIDTYDPGEYFVVLPGGQKGYNGNMFYQLQKYHGYVVDGGKLKPAPRQRCFSSIK